MRRVLLGLSLGLVSFAALAEETAPVIDLSAGQPDVVVDEEYQSIRPGAMDERFRNQPNTGGTSVNLSYEDPDGEKDEYGLYRDRPSDRVGYDPTTPPPAAE